jgi:tetratricopeptide (TPR) repeat protein
MSGDDAERAARLFQLAMECEPGAREALLDRQCAGDALLRAEVEALLRADAVAGGFLDHPLAASASSRATSAEAPSPLIGARIGRYQIRRIIASGGMGTVYEARQEQPRRTVALKVMRAEMTSPEAQRRFEYESQILGALQHPGIAQVYEAGTERLAEGDGAGAAAAGGVVPFYAMELVAGARTIAEFAAEKNLGTRERIALFAQVCDAVQFAHNKGVIHRDLKPGNILIDAAGHPKVIDFGVARVMSADILGASLRTMTGQLIGTLRYMSPEQVQGDPHAIDTRSDVYALGVVLYELLTGRLPYTFPADSAVQAPRIISEVQPQRPSTIERSLRGDIETILLKALEKDRERRYQSAGAMAADLRRFLSKEPIHARPASAGYQLRMFARRNGLLVGSAGAVVLAVIAGLVASLLLWRAAVDQRDRARQATQLATRQATRARAATEFLGDALRSANPFHSQSRDMTVRQMLEAAAARLDAGAFAGQPAVEAAVRTAMASTYLGLGLSQESQKHAQRAVDLLLPSAQESPLEAGIALVALGDSLLRNHQLEVAESRLRLAVELLRTAPGDQAIDLAESLFILGSVLRDRGDRAGAEAALRESLTLFDAAVGRDDPLTARVLGDFATTIMHNPSRREEALALIHEAMEIGRRNRGGGASGARAAMNLVRYATVLHTSGDLDAAAQAYREAIDAGREFLGPGHGNVLACLSNLSFLYRSRGEDQKALETAEELVAAARQSLSSDSPQLLVFLHEYADVLQTVGRRADSVSLYREILSGAEHGADADERRLLVARIAVARDELEQGRLDEAAALAAACLAADESILPPAHWIRASAHNILGCVALARKDYAAAEPSLVAAHAMAEKLSPPVPELVPQCAAGLIELFDATGRPDRAAELRALAPSRPSK